MNRIGIVNFLRGGLRLLRQGWRQMAVYCLAIWVVNVILLVPPTLWVLKKLGSCNGDVIVGNYGMSQWLFTVRGVAYVLLAGSIIPFSIILFIVGLFRIANASVDNAAKGVRESMAWVFVAAPRLLRFSLYVFGICLIFASLLAVGLGAVYLFLLSRHDINYYKTVHPPQWYWALALAGLWILMWAVTAGYFLLRSIFVLPFWLYGSHTIRGAFRMSWKKTHGQLKPLASVFGLFIVIWIAACIVLEGGIFLGIGFALTYLVSSVNGILYLVSVHLITSTVLEAILNFVGLAWCVCIWVVCYRHLTDSKVIPKSQTDLSLKQLKSFTKLLKIFRPRMIFPIIAGLLLISFLFSVWMLRHAPDKSAAPLIIAHRAGTMSAPENTLAALEKTIREGVSDYAEIDVQLTLDEVVVVAHDKDLMKVSNDPRVIRETNFSELSEVDIGRAFGPEFAGQRLSTLADFLRAGTGRISFVIEFKQSEGTDLVEKTISTVKQLEMQDAVVLMSLDLNDIRRAQQLTTAIPISYLAVTEVGDLTQLDVDFIGIRDKNITAKRIRAIQAQGIPVYAWTVDEGERILELIEMGIDGIITNDPVRAAAISKRYQTLNPAQRTLLTYRRFWGIFYKMGLWGAPTTDAER